MENLNNNIKMENIYQLDISLKHLTDTLTLATDKAVPKVTTKHNNKQKHQSAEILQAIKQGKVAHRQWKDAGKPDQTHQTSIQRKQAKRTLRNAQNQATALERQKMYTTIENTSRDDKTLMYKLIARQRQCDITHVTELDVNGTRISGDQEINEAFTEHFSALATPTPHDNFDEHYSKLVDQDVNILEKFIQSHSFTIIPITAKEIRYYISRLNKGKAPDELGLMAEHLKYADDSILDYLAKLCTAIVNLRHIPEELKTSTLSSILKKGKPKLDRNSFRGISVSALISKLVEHLILAHSEGYVLSNQDDLQFGFTKGASPAQAILLVTEAIQEQNDLGQPLYLATLDAQKAFDIVNQNSLLRKYYISGLCGPWWHIKALSYRDIKSKVKWKNTLGQSFSVKQGVRQGGIPSATDYKHYINELLVSMRTLSVGLHIGSIHIPDVGCADDIILLSKSIHALGTLLNSSKTYANKERYFIHPIKSTASAFNCGIPTEVLSDCEMWEINGVTLPVVNSFTHLGIDRYIDKSSQVSPFIHDRICQGRRTLYALMGAGLHGLNGLPPIICYTIYTIYVLPRYTSGLEAIYLNKKELEILESFHRKTLRQFQNLPQSCATSAVYLLLGARPLEAEIHHKMLSLFGAITRNKHSTIAQLAKRQLIMKSLKSNSWFSRLIYVFHQYELGSPLGLLDTPIPKRIWNRLIKKKINQYWTIHLHAEAGTKSSLSLLSL
jgi:hypothetical protein